MPQVSTVERPAAPVMRTVSASLYRPELDALRCVAFLVVFFGHSHLIAGTPLSGWDDHANQSLRTALALSAAAGMQLFFLLSAFVITRLLRREQERNGTVDIPSFYKRRILRLWPLYLFALLVSFLGARYVDGDHRIGFYLANLFLVGNFAPVLNLAAHSPFPVDHLWSISVEEQFYLLFPVMAKYASRKILTIACALTLIAGTLSLPLIQSQTADMQWRNTLPQLPFFAAGVLLALLYPLGRQPQWSTLKRLALGFAGALAIVLVRWIEVSSRAAGMNSSSIKMIALAVVVCGCSAILLSVLGIERPMPPPMLFFGKLSLGLYVFHIFAQAVAVQILNPLRPSGWMTVFEKDMLGLTLTATFALISYYALERPFLKSKDRLSLLPARPL